MDLVIYLMDIQTLLAISVILLLTFSCLSTWRPSRFPPGPVALPVIGNLAIFAKYNRDVHIKFHELSHYYGPVIGLKLGGYPTVIVHGYEASKDALVNKASLFSGRPGFLYIFRRLVSPQGVRRGIAWADGDHWKEMRKIAVGSLRNVGSDKGAIQEKIQREAHAMCTEVAKQAGKTFCISSLAQEAVSNVICSLCFGSRFEYNDLQFKRLMEMINYNMANNSFTAPVNYMPLLRHLPGHEWVDQVIQNYKELEMFIEEEIAQHKANFDSSSLRDLVDVFISQEEKMGEQQEIFKHRYIRVIVELFLAGTETTSASLQWLLLYMIRYPEVQTRCQQDILRVIGPDRTPALGDRANLSFVQATIQEVQRLANVVPFTIPHSTTDNTTLCGYRIPAQTVILVNLYSVHMDANHWKKPHQFNPERWLTAEGKFGKKDAFIPFSLGPRICLGDTLAKNELFLFFTFLLQRFTFTVTDEANPPPIEGRGGLTISPLRYTMNVAER